MGDINTNLAFIVWLLLLKGSLIGGFAACVEDWEYVWSLNHTLNTCPAIMAEGVEFEVFQFLYMF